MRPDVLAARINLRVAELRLLAAKAFMRRSHQPPPARALPGVRPGDVDAPWRPSPSTARNSIRASRSGGDGRSS